MTAVPDDRLVTVFGGSGFIGRHLVRALARSGWRIRVAVRRPDLAFHLQPLGRVGQIHAVQANLRFADSVQRAAEGADAIINLVGILHKSGKQTFDAVQAQGADPSRAKRPQRTGPSLCNSRRSAPIRSRSRTMRAARRRAKPRACRRPRRGDRAALDRVRARGSFFQPLRRDGDRIAVPPLDRRRQDALSAGLCRRRGGRGRCHSRRRAQPGATYELGGPEVRTFEELMQLMLRVIDRKRLLVPIPFAVARVQAFFLEMLPKPLLTRDQVRLLERDNVVSPEAERDGRTLRGLGIAPTAMETVLSSYLVRFRRSGQFWRRPA
jgi:uncharacterized protein YbjT (DUF2867 family)